MFLENLKEETDCGVREFRTRGPIETKIQHTPSTGSYVFVLHIYSDKPNSK